MNRIFWFLARFCLRLRYRVTMDGQEELRELRGPTLVLPNHPGYIDPAIVLAHVRLHQPLRPLVFAGTYRMPLLRPLMSLVRAFEVPDLSAASRDAQARTLEMIDSVVERLKGGDCFLIYPSGRLQRGNQEVIGAARAVHEIIQRSPNVNIVLVRTRGVWGSRFSCAANGTVPNLAVQARGALGWLLASCLFFLPRRPVHLHVEVVARNQLPVESRDKFNAHLEKWYNVDGGQQPLFVRYHHLFGPTEGDYRAKAAGADIDLAKIKPKTIEQVNHLLAVQLKRELTAEDLQPSTTLESLGLDSLERMDFALQVEKQFGFRSNQVLTTVGALWALADGQLSSGPTEPMEVPATWSQPRVASAKHDFEPLAETVGVAIVRRLLSAPNDLAVADRMSGVLTNRKLLVGAALMANQLKHVSGKRIGIMLPASVAADVVFLAAHLAGKTPVMLNWTTGPAGLAHAVAITECNAVVTSEKLVDRLDIQIKGAHYIFLESLRSKIGTWSKLGMLLATYLTPGKFVRAVQSARPDDPAVFLFTSGSESLPKTVPLTHRNLLTNVQDSLEILEPTLDDRLLGFLPPFHSFGLTGNVILPAVCGVPCVRFADPTDARGLVATIQAYQPTLLFTTPTFLSFIMAACQGDELKGLRVIVTGAERCPESLFEQCRRLAPKAVILEGYGITECSPVVSANRPSKTKPGTVGRPLQSVEARVVNLDTQQEVAIGETGMLLVRGPSIFDGYYQFDGPSPFVEFAGDKWYQTGDLVSMDDERYITFRGRLKRFLKAGGEMISLPALEEPFIRLFPPSEEGPRVAVEGVETPDGRHITLFTTFPYGLREASQVLMQAGFTGVMRLDEVRQLDKIPVLGTGKTDYKELRKQIAH